MATLNGIYIAFTLIVIAASVGLVSFLLAEVKNKDQMIQTLTAQLSKTIDKSLGRETKLDVVAQRVIENIGDAYAKVFYGPTQPQPQPVNTLGIPDINNGPEKLGWMPQHELDEFESLNGGFADA